MVSASTTGGGTTGTVGACIRAIGDTSNSSSSTSHVQNEAENPVVACCSGRLPSGKQMADELFDFGSLPVGRSIRPPLRLSVAAPQASRVVLTSQGCQ